MITMSAKECFNRTTKVLNDNDKNLEKELEVIQEKINTSIYKGLYYARVDELSQEARIALLDKGFKIDVFLTDNYNFQVDVCYIIKWSQY